ncbi:MAG: hypothetical protein MUE69_23905 [Myxococcota bacterium]|jgi:hypothetical protein|nr:hypothetical protein [Myxococcota bacterium]
MTESLRRDELQRLLEHRVTRTVLAVCIVVSLLPFAWVGALQTLFLVVFGLELTLRLGATARRRRARAEDDPRPSRAELVFLLVDFLAWVSFLPLDQLFGLHASWLRGLRLFRLLLLFRLGRPLIVDLWRVLTRREQLQQLGLVTAAVLALSFLSAIVLTQLAVPHDYDGVDGIPEDFWDRVWWSFRQVESPDNLVAHLGEHPIVLVVSFLLTITGIFVFSYLIGVGTTVVDQVLRAERRRPVPFHSHTLVIGPIAESELLVREFVGLYEKNREGRRISWRAIVKWIVDPDHPRPRRYALPRMALLGPEEMPPPFLYEPTMRWVVHRRGNGDDLVALRLVAASEAKRVVIVSPPPRPQGDPDATTVTALAAFRSENREAHAFVEVRESANAEVVRALGGPGTHALDVSRVLGLFLVQHLLTPGVERIFQELLSASGHELYTHVFLDPDERRALAARPLDFTELRRRAREEGALLLGLFEGDEARRSTRDLIDAESLAARFCPHALGADSSAADRAATSGRASSAASVQGIFGIALNYAHLRTVAHACLKSGSTPPAPSAEFLLDELELERCPRPRRVVLVGYDSALRSLAEGLARAIDGVELVSVMSTERLNPGRRTRLGLGADGSRALENGGSLRVVLDDASVIAERAARLADDADAVVFLSDGREQDADAHTLLRVLRFAAALGHEGPELRCLVEVEGLADPEPVQAKLRLLSRRLRPVFLSTERLTRYFLVHSAFVPGVSAIYDALLSAQGESLVRIPLASRPDDARGLTFDALIETFAPLGCLPVAVEVSTPTGEEVLVNPSRDLRLERRVVSGVFALADRSRLEELLRRRTSEAPAAGAGDVDSSPE